MPDLVKLLVWFAFPSLMHPETKTTMKMVNSITGRILFIKITFLLY
jgi:hypothetical protein